MNFQISEDKVKLINMFSSYCIRFKNIIIICIFQPLKNEIKIIRSIVILVFWKIDQNKILLSNKRDNPNTGNCI